MKLTIELVPKTAWYANLRSALKKSQWDKLRKQVYEQASYLCQVCGGKGRKHPVECHEVWAYDDEYQIQKLVRMIALCPACHEVKHIGRAQMLGKGDRALKHLAKVNGLSLAGANAYLDQISREWAWRSNFEWTLDLNALADYGVELPRRVQWRA